MLYYKSGIVPNLTPLRLRLSDGTTITSPTHEQLLAEGWLVAPDIPAYNAPDVLDWIEPNWVVRAPNQSEIGYQWTEIKALAQRKLADTDYKVLKAVEATVLNGTTLSDELPVAYISYRQTLRDIYNNVGDIDPFNVVWPELPSI